MPEAKPVGTAAVTRTMRLMNIGRSEGMEKAVSLMGRILLVQETDPKRGADLAKRFRILFEDNKCRNPMAIFQKMGELEADLRFGGEG